MNSPSEVKARAHRLRDILSAKGHQLKHAESLEVISNLDGYPDWNTYTADIANQQQVADQNLNHNLTDKAGPSLDHPIINAIKLDNEILLRKLLSHKVLSNKAMMAEAFYQTVVLERVSLAVVLITEGADIGSVAIRGLSLLEFVLRTERYEYAEMLVYKFKHLKGIHGENSTVLPLIIQHYYDYIDPLEVTKILLDQGANINVQDQRGDTALILAGYVREDLNLVTYLVERGADVNIANENGDTALIDAADKGNTGILTFLLKNSADINIRNKHGHSALDLARHSENSEALRLLVEHKKLE